MAYIKYHSAWSATDQLAGKAWNHIESQWDEIKTDADAHNHDTRYYTKTLADATFFTTSFYTGFDADTLDGSHFTDLLASVMPLGAVMIWSGTDGNVPSGWHICDGGTYGGLDSPDLRDRFVIGAGGSSYKVGATGGPATWNGTITPTGSVTIGGHILTTAELPTHNHTFWESSNYPVYAGGLQSAWWSGMTSRASTILAQDVGDGAHGHPGSTASIAAIDPRPAFYSLYYIMKYL
jgi:hypothetical protein